MAELRWLLLAAGILVLAVIFWVGRRDAAGKSPLSITALKRLPSLGRDRSSANGDFIDGQALPGQSSTGAVRRIMTVRLTARGNGTFGGEALLLRLREAGLRHGRFGIFHKHDPKNEDVVLFSVASLVEPGSFDLARMTGERFPGISIFLSVTDTGDGIAAFDAMLSTSRTLASALDGELLDENGSRLSVQRERYLREEVIQLQHTPLHS
jgi:cell division protein ZipA